MPFENLDVTDAQRGAGDNVAAGVGLDDFEEVVLAVEVEAVAQDVGRNLDGVSSQAKELLLSGYGPVAAC